MMPTEIIEDGKNKEENLWWIISESWSKVNVGIYASRDLDSKNRM